MKPTLHYIKESPPEDVVLFEDYLNGDVNKGDVKDVYFQLNEVVHKIITDIYQGYERQSKYTYHYFTLYHLELLWKWCDMWDEKILKPFISESILRKQEYLCDVNRLILYLCPDSENSTFFSYEVSLLPSGAEVKRFYCLMDHIECLIYTENYYIWCLMSAPKHNEDIKVIQYKGTSDLVYYGHSIEYEDDVPIKCIILRSDNDSK